MYHTHESLSQGLLGTGLAPASQRFEQNLTESLDSLDISDEWVDYPDLLRFMEDNIGAAIVKAIFGPVLLSQNPTFILDLWNFDDVVVSLAKRLPEFCIPRAYRVRGRLLRSIKQWHEHARASSAGVEAAPDEDADPFWGSRMVRERNRMLLNVEHQDYNSVASTDLGFIWA